MIEAILKRGTLVSVITAMILLMGIIAALRVPIQMIPDLDVRIISVETGWPGATPQDVEKEILIEQEDYLRGLPNLKRMTSLASTGRAQIELEFPFGTDINEALLRVNNALSQVPSYPENVDEPVLRSDSFSYNAFLAFNVVPAVGNPKDVNINMMLDFVEDNVRPVLERVPGVSQVQVRGGAERQIQILTDASKLAERGLALTDLRDAIRARNTDVSAGDIDSGKRRYLLRTVGRFDTLEELENLIITRRGDSITRLSDVATVRLDHAELRNLSATDGEANIRLGVIRQTGSNVITIKESILPMLDEMNEDILAPAGLRMYLSNDDVRYVQDSVGNVRQNILIGAGLAVLVMFLFLRSPSATLIGMLGMPICTVAGFLGLLLFDRTINVISLAGIAFAIGMTIDNTIVVLESIEQQRQMGKTRFEAARDGTRHVWSAVLSGTMTTVLVFLPLMFVKEEAGQLFSDIGIAISSSIVVSMVVAVSLVPVAYANFAWRRGGKSEPPPPRRQFLLGPLFWLIEKPWRRLACLAVTVSATAAALVFLTPPAEYLPEGEEAKVFATMIAPPGYSLEEMSGIAKTPRSRAAARARLRSGGFRQRENRAARPLARFDQRPAAIAAHHLGNQGPETHRRLHGPARRALPRVSRHARVLLARLDHLQQRRRHPRRGAQHQRPRPAGDLSDRAARLSGCRRGHRGRAHQLRAIVPHARPAAAGDPAEVGPPRRDGLRHAGLRLRRRRSHRRRVCR